MNLYVRPAAEFERPVFGHLKHVAGLTKFHSEEPSKLNHSGELTKLSTSGSDFLGFHADRVPFAIHFNFYKLNDLPIESVNPLTGLTWGNITFEFRF